MKLKKKFGYSEKNRQVKLSIALRGGKGRAAQKMTKSQKTQLKKHPNRINITRKLNGEKRE
jgi:hypothetical protein